MLLYGKKYYQKNPHNYELELAIAYSKAAFTNHAYLRGRNTLFISLI